MCNPISPRPVYQRVCWRTDRKLRIKYTVCEQKVPAGGGRRGSWVVVCLAMELRDPRGEETAQQLQREYAHRLGDFCYALHPLIPGEVAGKSSNEN
jgi:hypothetical protein